MFESPSFVNTYPCRPSPPRPSRRKSKIRNPQSKIRMCLIAFALDAHPDYALVLAANRDEFYDRPTAPGHFWEERDDEAGILAGRDERAGGTWMGVTRGGRFAALTNVRGPAEERSDAPSRGALVKAFLLDDRAPRAFLESLAGTADAYNGFNLLAGTFAGAEGSRLAYFSNQKGGAARRVEAGVHGLSNAVLDTAWPKVKRSQTALRSLLEAGRVPPEALLDLLDDRRPADDEALPSTGVPQEWERALSSVFIQTEGYGTRSSTALLIGRGGAATLVERSFEEGSAPTDRHFSFQIEPN
jgi:uncharacterized protein with NRDE domain